MSGIRVLVTIATALASVFPLYGLTAAQQDDEPFMKESGPTLAPFAHVEFCLNSPVECSKRAGPLVIALTQENETRLRKVNTSVNESIIPKEDSPHQETWTLNPSAGDCNDYAVTKRSDLIKVGIPGPAVRLAVAKTPEGEGHAVVVVRTTKGDMVLDNRTDSINRWDHTDLTWLKVETAKDPKMWDDLEPTSR